MSDATTFFVSNTLRAFEGDTLVFNRTREASVPRDFFLNPQGS